MNKKKMLSLILCCFMVLSVGLSTSFAEEDIKININGKLISTESSPVIRNGRVLVPISVITKELGYKTEWNSTDKSVKIFFMNEAYSKLTIGQKEALGVINFLGKEEIDKYQIEIAPEIISGRVFLPLKDTTEIMGGSVEWNSTTRTVFVNNKKILATEKDDLIQDWKMITAISVNDDKFPQESQEFEINSDKWAVKWITSPDDGYSVKKIQMLVEIYDPESKKIFLESPNFDKSMIDNISDFRIQDEIIGNNINDLKIYEGKGKYKIVIRDFVSNTTINTDKKFLILVYEKQ